MPWFCAFCSRWNLSRQRVCPYCGRAARGRLCRRCKERVPRDAAYCVSCGSDNLTEPGGRRLRLNVGARIVLIAAILGGGGGLVRLVMPWIQRGLLWLEQVLWTLSLYLLLFWILTALLPPAWRQRLRRAAGWMLRLIARLLVILLC